METGCRHTGLVLRQWSLSCFTPAAPLVVYPIFPRSHPSLSLFLSYLTVLSVSCLDFCPFTSAVPLRAHPALLLFIQSDVFTSLNSFISMSLPCSQISISSSHTHTHLAQHVIWAPLPSFKYVLVYEGRSDLWGQFASLTMCVARFQLRPWKAGSTVI